MKVKNILSDIQISPDRLESEFNVYEDSSGQNYLNLIKKFNVVPPYIFNRNFEKLHIITPSDNYFYISQLYYGTINLWWFICVYNNILNPLEIAEPGNKLRILKKEYVYQILDSNFNS
jgi:hypothetical protein